MLVSDVQQNESAIHKHVYPFFFRFFSQIGHQRVEYWIDLPRYIVGTCDWSILYIPVCICQSQTPNSSLPQCFQFGIHKCGFKVFESVPALWINYFVSFIFRFHILVIWYDIFLTNLIYLIWQCIGPSRFLQIALFHAFRGWIIFHRIYLPKKYPFFCLWMFRWLSCLGYCK